MERVSGLTKPGPKSSNNSNVLPKQSDARGFTATLGVQEAHQIPRSALTQIRRETPLYAPSKRLNRAQHLRR